MLIPINRIRPNPEQPRKDFNQAELQELASSIGQHGLINPISVEQVAEDVYQLIDGERRWRAAQLAGLKEIKADVRPAMNGGGAQERLTLAMVANLQREDLDPIEEALAYQKLMDVYNQGEIAELLNKGRGTIIMRLRLLDFEPQIQELFKQRKLPLDNNVIKALEEIPDAIRVKVATGFANRGSTGKAIVMACRRLKVRYMAEPINIATSKAPKNKVVAKSYPAARLVRKKTPSASWPDNIDQAAEETCKECPFSDVGNLTICTDCPLPMLMKKLAE